MILITGASSGIGEATARRFAKEGRDLLLVARRKEKLESLEKEFRSLGVNVISSVLDVRNGESIRAWGKKNTALLEKTSVLINNAGLAKGMVPFQESDPSEWKEMTETNIDGVLSMTHLLLPFFLKKNEGHIVNMGSVASRWIYPKGNIYCATKAAIHAFSESLRLDLLGKNIRVTEISPGLVETEFSEVRFNGDKTRAKKVYEGIKALSPEDIAEAIYWAVKLPSHMNVQEMILYPVHQASPSFIHRITE